MKMHFKVVGFEFRQVAALTKSKRIRSKRKQSDGAEVSQNAVWRLGKSVIVAGAWGFFAIWGGMNLTNAQDISIQSFSTVASTPERGTKPAPLKDVTATISIAIGSGEPEVSVGLEWQAEGVFEFQGNEYQICADFAAPTATTCELARVDERFDVYAKIAAVLPIQTEDEFQVFLQTEFPTLLPMNRKFAYTLPLTWGTLFQHSAVEDRVLSSFSSSQAKSIWAQGFNVGDVALTQFVIVLQPQ